MAFICQQEGIEADSEALAVLAQAGEGSVRDSFPPSTRPSPAAERSWIRPKCAALLGMFSLDSLEQVTAGSGSKATRGACSTW